MVKGDRTFWGFDTFAGLKDVSNEDKHWGVAFFQDGDYSADAAGRRELPAGLF